MAAKSNNEVPPVPVPPTGATPPAVPPIEPAPAAKAAPKSSAGSTAKSAPKSAPKSTAAGTVPIPPPAPAAASAATPAAAVAPPVMPPAPQAPAAPAYGAPGYAYTPPPAGPPQGLSITSMILGIAGLFFGFLVSIAAVITAHMAQKSQPYAKPFWLTGIITGYIGIGIGVIALIVFILWFAFILSVAGSSSSFYGF